MGACFKCPDDESEDTNHFGRSSDKTGDRRYEDGGSDDGEPPWPKEDCNSDNQVEWSLVLTRASGCSRSPSRIPEPMTPPAESGSGA